MMIKGFKMKLYPGHLMSDGAGILVLEDMEKAKKRGAKIYAEIVGFASTSDSNHITSPLKKKQNSILNKSGTSTRTEQARLWATFQKSTASKPFLETTQSRCPFPAQSPKPGTCSAPAGRSKPSSRCTFSTKGLSLPQSTSRIRILNAI